MTDHAAVKNLHHVTVKHERNADGEIVHTDLTFECRGDIASRCHVYPDCGCEGWGEEHDAHHPRVPHAQCWLQDWFDAGYEATPYDPIGSGGEEYYEHDLPEHSGPIAFDYDDGILWRWADAAALGLTPTTPNQEQQP